MVINRDFAGALANIVGRDHVRSAPGELAVYARDATPMFHRAPDVVVFPCATAEVSRILGLASDHKVPVVPRGAGSNLCAGTVPVCGGIVLSMTRTTHIIEISADEMLARVQPGVTTARLADCADASGLLNAPDPAVHLAELLVTASK